MADEQTNRGGTIGDKYYPLPTQHLESIKTLGDLLSLEEAVPAGSSDAHKLQIVRVGDKKRLTILKDSVNWQAYAVKFGMGLASGAGSWVAGRVLDFIFPPTTTQLSKDAIQEIGDVIRSAVDDAFLSHYLREVEGVSNALKTFRETGEERKLNEAEGKCDSLLPHLKSYGARGLGGFVMAANLHLAAILAKAEVNPGYRATYNRLKVDYAGHGIGTANEVRHSIETRVGGCQCRTVTRRGEGSHRACSLQTEHDHVEHWDNEFNSSNPDELCAHQKQWSDEVATSHVQNQVNPIVATCNSWTG